MGSGLCNAAGAHQTDETRPKTKKAELKALPHSGLELLDLQRAGSLRGTCFPSQGQGESDDKFLQLIKKPHFNNIAELLN